MRRLQNSSELSGPANRILWRMNSFVPAPGAVIELLHLIHGMEDSTIQTYFVQLQVAECNSVPPISYLPLYSDTPYKHNRCLSSRETLGSHGALISSLQELKSSTRSFFYACLNPLVLPTLTHDSGPTNPMLHGTYLLSAASIPRSTQQQQQQSAGDGMRSRFHRR